MIAALDAKLVPDDSLAQVALKPTKPSSFYGKDESNIEDRENDRYRKTGELLLLKRHKQTQLHKARSRRDFEVFRDEQKKEIIIQCPELMLEYDEGVFRAAARAMWEAADPDTKQKFRNIADKEKHTIASVRARDSTETDKKLKVKESIKKGTTKKKKPKVVKVSKLQNPVRRKKHSTP